jgi:hypothetical protein
VAGGAPQLVSQSEFVVQCGVQVLASFGFGGGLLVLLTGAVSAYPASVGWVSLVSPTV